MQPGDILAHYEIRAPLGKGGMGEVFLATDTKLGRDVALKILPEDFARDAERVARFRREAQVLASLNHPNISAIYGLEEDRGRMFLAMELMEGKDLAARLKSGPLPEDEAVEIIRRIADGLTAAHRNGIVHRDLKPANVMITPDGTVKILDFGLARAYTGDAEDGSDPTYSPTITAAMTQAGTILGTAAYMAPEQARGKQVDQRADIWAMGTILFEMLTGRRLFEGETISDVLASVIKIEPDLDALPAGTSPPVRRMLRRCLQRDPRQRLHSAADAVLELDEVEPETAVETSKRRTILPWVLVGLLGVALAAVGLRPSGGPTAVAPRQYELQFPKGTSSSGSYLPIISPDGKWLATTLEDSLGARRILLRSLETGSQEFMENTLGGEFPFWSPDSRFLGFFQRGVMRKLHIESNTVQEVTRSVEGSSRGGTWSTQGKILFSPGSNDGLLLIDDEGGETRVITVVDTTMVDGSDRWPQFLPDGTRFVFTRWSNVLAESSQKGGIFLGSLEGGTPRRLLRDASAAVVSSSGHLLFHRNGRLMSIGFDTGSGEIAGEPQLVSEAVSFQESNGSIGVSVNGNGDIFLCDYDPDTGMRLGWADRQGQLLEIINEDLPMVFGIDLARDEKHYSVELLDDVGSVEIWIGDIDRRSLSRLSRSESDCWGAGFSPDGSELIYAVQDLPGGILYRQNISGARMPETVLKFDKYDNYNAVSHWFAPDRALVTRQEGSTKGAGVFLLDFQDKEMTTVLDEDFDQAMGRISPDGRWLAYMSNETGIPEIYLRNWPSLDHKWQVSRAGGINPHWSSKGDELVFASPAGREIFAVAFAGGGDEPVISLPRQITALADNMVTINYTADHQRFLVGYSLADPDLPPVKVLVGWAKRNRP